MAFRVVLLIATVFIGSYAFPTAKEDVSIYFDRSNPSSRIIGGSVAEHSPHMVALTIGMRFRSLLCGSSLVTPTHILTAAHCIQNAYSMQALSPSLVGYAGNSNWFAVDNGITFSHNITHPHYQSVPVIKNDIGFLVTRREVGLGENIRLVALSFDWIDAGVATTVSGWGRTSAGGSASDILYTLMTQVIDGEACRRDIAAKSNEMGLYDAPVVEPHIELCTFLAANTGTCSGDSGSPVMRSDTNEQIGVVSWGIPCAVGAPDVNVRVSAFSDWINQILP